MFVGRKLRMYCVEVEEDGSEFELRFEIDGEVVDKITGYCIEDILIYSPTVLAFNCEKYNFDSRFDNLSIELNYKF